MIIRTVQYQSSGSLCRSDKFSVPAHLLIFAESDAVTVYTGQYPAYINPRIHSTHQTYVSPAPAAYLPGENIGANYSLQITFAQVPTYSRTLTLMYMCFMFWLGVAPNSQSDTRKNDPQVPNTHTGARQALGGFSSFGLSSYTDSLDTRSGNSQ